MDEHEQDAQVETGTVAERRSFLRWAGAGAVGGALVTHLGSSEAAEAAAGDFFITVDALPANTGLGPGTRVHVVNGTESYQVRADNLVNEVGHTIATIGGPSATTTTWGDAATIGNATDIVAIADSAAQTLRLGAYAGFGPNRPGPIIRIFQAGTKAVKFESTTGGQINSLPGGTAGAIGPIWSKGRWSVVQARPLLALPPSMVTVWVVWGDLTTTDPG